MKKLIFFFLTTFICANVSAQDLELGVKAGANFANISDVTDSSSRTGLLFGVFAGIKFSDKIAIQPELLYSQQEAEFDADKIDLNYVNIPVLLKYYVAGGLNLQAGPQFGFVVDDNLKDSVAAGVEAESFDLTGVVGVGYDFPFGIRIDGRYNFGFTEVVKDGNGKNSVASIAIGYSFL